MPTRMRALALAMVLLLATSASGCIDLGPTPWTLAPAISPRGAKVRLLAADGTLLARGELIALADSGVVLDDGVRLLHLPRRTFSAIDAKPIGRFATTPESKWRATVASLRPAARFPQGLTPALERRWLEATGRSVVTAANE